MNYQKLSREFVDLALVDETVPRQWRPLFAAVGGGCGLLVVVPGDDRPFDLPPSGPWLAVIGDDLDRSWGPSGYDQKSLRRLVQHVGCAAVVAAEPLPEAYAAVAAVVMTSGRPGLIVETRMRHEIEWLAFIRENNQIPLINVTMATGQA